MRGDYSKIPFNEKKRTQHYRKVYLPQGKVLLDSDLNENTDLLQHQTMVIAKDALCLCGSPNSGFRIGGGVPLLPVDDKNGWSATPGTASLTVDYFEKFEGKGSLKLVSAAGVEFTVEKTLDLSRYRWIRLIIKRENETNAFKFYVVSEGQAGTNLIGTTKQLKNGYSAFKYLLSGVTGLDKIKKIRLGLDSAATYHIGAVECSPSMFTLDSMALLAGWSYEEPTPKVGAEISIVSRNGEGTAIKVKGIQKLFKRLATPVDFSNYENMEFAIKGTTSTSIQFYITDGTKTSYWQIGPLTNNLEKYSKSKTNLSNDPGGPADMKSIKEYGFRNLPQTNTYYFGRILYEMSSDKNFVVAGMDVLSGETGRLYVRGELYEKEEAETYLNQKDYPSAPKITLPGTGKKRKDIVYADVWQWHVTSVEDVQLREVALGGPDTCNRMKAVAQVKVLQGAEVDPAQTPPEPILDAAGTGRGRLSTLVEYTARAASPCEITPEAEYTGWENRLYRVEIHKPGNVGTATYKWSRNNAATVSPIVNNVAQGASSIVVKDARLFRIGDIIEISDDTVELSDNEVSAGNAPPTKRMGELRQIIDIDQDENKLIWSSTSSALSLQLTGGMNRGYTAEGADNTHPKARKWDGADATRNSEILLEDGVKIKFSGSNTDTMLTGDYWTFTTRVNTREIEKLDNELPHGVVHRYCQLAVIEWDDSGMVDIEDRRARFEPLCGLTAADIGFDRTNIPSFSNDVQNVQQAIESIIFPDNLTVNSLTLKCQNVPENKWPKLSCKQGDILFFLDGAQTEKIRILANGNIGMGTANPAGKLQIGELTGRYSPDSPDKNGLIIVNKDEEPALTVLGASYSRSFLRLGDVNEIALEIEANNDDDSSINVKGNSSGLIFNVKGQEIIHIKNTNNVGKVGIGTATPGAKLEVNLQNSQGWSGPLEALRINSPDNRYWMDLRTHVIASGNVGYSFRTRNEAGATADALTIDTVGKVGIGTSPSARIEVTGDATNPIFIVNTQGITSNPRTFTIKNNGQGIIGVGGGSYPGAWTSALAIQSNDNTRQLWMSPLDSASKANARIRAVATGLDIHVGGTANDQGTQALTLNSDGKVGIGTATPGAKLEVNLQNSLRWGGPLEALRINSPDNRYWMDLRTHVIASGNVGYSFRTRNEAGAIADGLTVDTFGKVGIGTTEPKAKLHIIGNAGVLNLEGSDHAYIQWYPDGFAAGRKAWTGFGDAATSAFTVANEGGDIILNPKYETQINSDLRLSGRFLFLNSSGGLAQLTHEKYNNEGTFRNNNIKFWLGTYNTEYQSPPDWEFIIGHTGSAHGITNFQKKFSINSSGDLYCAGSKAGYVVDHFVNRVGDTLEQGDIVVISEHDTSHYSGDQNSIPIPEVDLTAHAYDPRVCGIVVKVSTEKDLPYVEISDKTKAEIKKSRKATKEHVQPSIHPLEKFAAKYSLDLDKTKVQDKQMGTMVTLGAFAYCKVDADIAPIGVGDLLTTSPTKGHAQKVLEPEKAIGAIVGKALGSLKKGKGQIPVLVMLQ